MQEVCGAPTGRAGWSCGPAIWAAYRQGLQRRAEPACRPKPGLRRAWEAACLGDTGIDGFDHWAQELVATGYLHNHARMWFASIWIFTLRLPWELGADFFLRHLLDGDPASNTLSAGGGSAGLQTPGKTYLATGRQHRKEHRMAASGPKAWRQDAPPLPLAPPPAPRLHRRATRLDPTAPTLLLVTEEDLCPEILH